MTRLPKTLLLLLLCFGCSVPEEGLVETKPLLEKPTLGDPKELELTYLIVGSDSSMVSGSYRPTANFTDMISENRDFINFGFLHEKLGERRYGVSFSLNQVHDVGIYERGTNGGCKEGMGNQQFSVWSATVTITEFNPDFYYMSGSIDAKYMAKKEVGDGFDSIFVKCKFNRIDMTRWSDSYDGRVEGPNFTFVKSPGAGGWASYYEQGDSLIISYDWEDPDMRNYHSRSFDLKLDNPGSPNHKANEKNHWVYKDNSTKTSSTSTDELKITRWDPARRKMDANFTLKGEKWEIKNMSWFWYRK